MVGRSPTVLRIVAALLVDQDNRALLVRKTGTISFMQPGGKPERGETPAQALARELQEELGLVVQPAELAFVGSFRAEAANEPDTIVDADVFDAPVILGAVVVANEIEEFLWVDPADPGDVVLAPLSRDHLLPLLAARATDASAP